MGLDLAHVLSPERHYCELQCAVCNCLTSLDSYVTATCSHPICKDCLKSDGEVQRSCPMCFQDTGGFFFSLKQAQPLALRILGRVKVACPYRHSSSERCSWAGDYQQMAHHIEVHHKEEAAAEFLENNTSQKGRIESSSPPSPGRAPRERRIRRRDSVSNNITSSDNNVNHHRPTTNRRRKSSDHMKSDLDRGGSDHTFTKERRERRERKSRRNSLPGESSNEHQHERTHRRNSMEHNNTGRGSTRERDKDRGGNHPPNSIRDSSCEPPRRGSNDGMMVKQQSRRKIDRENGVDGEDINNNSSSRRGTNERELVKQLSRRKMMTQADEPPGEQQLPVSTTRRGSNERDRRKKIVTTSQAAKEGARNAANATVCREFIPDRIIMFRTRDEPLGKSCSHMYENIGSDASDKTSTDNGNKNTEQGQLDEMLKKSQILDDDDTALNSTERTDHARTSESELEAPVLSTNFP